MTIAKIRIDLKSTFRAEPTREYWPSSFEDKIKEGIRWVSQYSMLGEYSHADFCFYDQEERPQFKFSVHSQYSGKWTPNGLPIPLDNGKVDIIYQERPDRDIKDAMPYIDMAKRLVPHGSRFVIQRWWENGAEDVVEGL